MTYKTPVIQKQECGETVYRTALENEPVNATYTYSEDMTECYIQFQNESESKIQELVSKYNLIQLN